MLHEVRSITLNYYLLVHMIPLTYVSTQRMLVHISVPQTCYTFQSGVQEMFYQYLSGESHESKFHEFSELKRES